MILDPAKSQQTVGNHTVATQLNVSPRQTHHMLFTVWNRNDGLASGAWRVTVDEVQKQDRLVGRIVDRYSSWGVGIRWLEPTRDRGTMVFPSTADSAVGVAAFGGRHDMPGFFLSRPEGGCVRRRFEAARRCDSIAIRWRMSGLS